MRGKENFFEITDVWVKGQPGLFADVNWNTFPLQLFVCLNPKSKASSNQSTDLRKLGCRQIVQNFVQHINFGPVKQERRSLGRNDGVESVSEPRVSLSCLFWPLNLKLAQPKSNKGLFTAGTMTLPFGLKQKFTNAWMTVIWPQSQGHPWGLKNKEVVGEINNVLSTILSSGWAKPDLKMFGLISEWEVS